MSTQTGAIAFALLSSEGPTNPGFDAQTEPAGDAAELLSSVPFGSRTAEQPVAEVAATRAGGYWPAFGFLDYFNRIHFSELAINLGNLVSNQIRELRVFNAYFVDQRLNDILPDDAEGLELTEPVATPLTLGPLEELTYEISVSTNGPPEINATYTFEFDVGDFVVSITGQRIIAWSWLPNWGNSIREKLGWLTDILASESGAEQRRALRIAPRRVFEAQVSVDGLDRRLLDLALFAWGGRNWALPIWHDVQVLPSDLSIGATSVPCIAEHRDFREGGLAILRGRTARDVEAVQIESITSTTLELTRPTLRAWSKGTRLYPARTAQLLEQPPLSRLTDQATELDVRFLLMEPCDWPELMPATMHEDLPVFADRPEESEDLTNGYARILAELDNATGIPDRHDTAGRGFIVQGHRAKSQGAAEAGAFRSFLYALRGRHKAVWLPSHADDLTIVATIASNATNIDIEYVGYTRFSNGAVGRRDIRIELWSGTRFHRRISGSSEIDDATERLSITESLGVTVEPANISRVSFMALCRLDQDEIELEHVTDVEGVTSAELMFRSTRDDL